MQTIHLDISNKGNIPTIYAKQGDVGRKFSVVITDAGIPRLIEDGEAFSVWYEGASGVGNYSEIGDNSAFTIEGNTVTVEIIAQALNNAGNGYLCLIMESSDGNQIGTWNIPYAVEAVPGLGSKPAEQHLNALVDAQNRAESSAIDASVYAQDASMYRDEAKNWAEAAEDAANRAESAGGGGGGSANAVLYTKQTLTEEQKAQARENIGATTLAEVESAQPKLELIETITIANGDEAVSTIKRTGLKLDAAVVRIDTSAASEASSVEVSFAYNNTTLAASTQTPYTTTAKRCVWELYKHLGYWEYATFGQNRIWGTTKTIYPRYCKEISAEANPYITTIAIVGAEILTHGATISIYGVRRNEN